MKYLKDKIFEKLIINKNSAVEKLHTSELYEVIATTRDINNGNADGEIIVARFTKKTDAEQYKKDWEDLYKEHDKNNDSSSPCWIDFEPKLKINKTELFTNYNSNILIQQYSYEEE